MDRIGVSCSTRFREGMVRMPVDPRAREGACGKKDARGALVVRPSGRLKLGRRSADTVGMNDYLLVGLLVLVYAVWTDVAVRLLGSVLA
jgi:hypothetical protein